MARYKLLIEYDGRPFCGWQRQPNAPSVQQALEVAVLRFCGEVTTVEGAGRTDAGVHATGMVAHVDIAKPTEPRVVRNAINAHIAPNPVSVLAAEEMAANFHARFSAIERQYIYTIVNRVSPLTHDRGLAWHVPQALNIAAMQSAAEAFIGQHDFTSFRSTSCQAKSPVKTLDGLSVVVDGQCLRIHARALSFLHNQIRIITGALVKVGRGKWTCDDILAALDAKDRNRGPETAPPFGLTLSRVIYPSDT